MEDRLRQGNAPWDGYAEAAVSLTPAMKALDYPAAKAARGRR